MTPVPSAAAERPVAIDGARAARGARGRPRRRAANGSLQAGSELSSSPSRPSAPDRRRDRALAALRRRTGRRADRPRGELARDRRRGSAADLVDEAPQRAVRPREPSVAMRRDDRVRRRAPSSGPGPPRRQPQQPRRGAQPHRRARGGWPGSRPPPGGRTPTASSMSRRLNAASLTLVEDLQHADRALVVDERHRDDRPRDVAGLLGDGPAEARVERDVRQRERLTGREHVAGEALVGRDRQADDALALARQPRPGRRADPSRRRTARSRPPRRRTATTVASTIERRTASPSASASRRAASRRRAIAPASSARASSRRLDRRARRRTGRRPLPPVTARPRARAARGR